MEKDSDAVWEFLKKGQKAIGEGGSLSGSGEHIENAKTVGWPPRTVAGVQWSWPDPVKWALCAVGVRTGEVRLSKPFGAQKITGEFQMSNIELFILSEFGKDSICL